MESTPENIPENTPESTPTKHTRHKEYSLVAAALAAGMLLLVGIPQSLLLLLVVNIISIASILYSAFSVIRHADVLAHRYGEPYGSLILSLAITILEVGLISTLMLTGSAGATMMRDTIYSVVLIVMSGFIGFALLMGGRKYRSQSFNFTGIKHFLISIIPLAAIVLVLPTALGNGGTYNALQKAVVALCCVLMYIYFLRIQTVTHRKFFVFEDEDEDAHHHGMPSTRSSAWHFLLLGIHLVAVIGVTKLNSAALDSLLQNLGAPAGITGFLVALLILSPEGAGAFKSILENQVQRAMNLLLGSVLATISLTVPVIIVVAALTGQELVMGLDIPSIVLMLCTFLVCQTSLTGGRTNAHSGAAHVVLFLTYLMLLFS